MGHNPGAGAAQPEGPVAAAATHIQRMSPGQAVHTLDHFLQLFMENGALQEHSHSTSSLRRPAQEKGNLQKRTALP